LLQLWLTLKALLLLIGLFKLYQLNLFPFRLVKFATRCNVQTEGVFTRLVQTGGISTLGNRTKKVRFEKSKKVH
jgi:hypothetical protein